MREVYRYTTSIVMSLKNWLTGTKPQQPLQKDANQHDVEEQYITSHEGRFAANDWTRDTHDNVVVQRNFLVVLSICLTVTIALSVLVIGYMKSSQTIEPFVIEIEPKTGVPTVVDPVTITKYSADESVKRYFIMQYVKAREEYIYGSYLYNYYTVVRVLSTPTVYYSDYRKKASPTNKDSLYVTCGENCSTTIALKSLIFQTEKSAQIRIKVTSNNTNVQDKIVYMEFDFKNLQMNDEERMINPLGFVVTLYRIADENV